MKSLVLIGRILFSLIFLNTIMAHFTSQGIDYAAASGVPMANIVVPVSGIIAILGGLSIVFGYKARAGAWLLVLFLIPVTFMMHNFWALEGAEAQTQMTNFIKNLSLLGGALIIAYFGAGPLSIDNRKAAYTTVEGEAAGRQKFEPKLSREYQQTRTGKVRPDRKEKVKRTE